MAAPSLAFHNVLLIAEILIISPFASNIYFPQIFSHYYCLWPHTARLISFPPVFSTRTFASLPARCLRKMRRSKDENVLLKHKAVS